MKTQGIIRNICDVIVDMDADARKFDEKGNFSAGTRVRKDALTLIKLCRKLREVIQEAKTQAKA